MRSKLRWLALLVLLAICTQMAVCMAQDYHDHYAGSAVPSGSDCSCHDCGCCSLHVGFPGHTETFITTLIERVAPEPIPSLTEKPRPRFDHPPRN